MKYSPTPKNHRYYAPETICDPDWGEQWKKYFMPIRVSNNIIVKPTWERYTPASRDIVIEIDPGNGLRHRPARVHKNVHRSD
jgi:ribosomal protein L11 methylase PrmA